MNPSADRFDPGLVKGSTELLVLAVLGGGALHGYAVIQRLAELSHARLRLNEGALYPVLHRLERERKVRRDFWAKLKRFAARVPFVDDLVAAYYCALDPATPIRVRGMLLAALAYFILPTDFIPDILGGLGFADDMALLTAVIGLVSSHITPTHRAAAARALDKELPKQT